MQRTERRIPATVWGAAAALGVVSVVQAALALTLARGGQIGWGQFLFAAVLAVALVTGLLKGARLAWMWARWLALFLGVVVCARAAVAVFEGTSVAWLTAVVLAGIAAPLFGTAFALARPSAMAFFGLVCPLCGAETRLSADLLFRQARCRACGNVW